MTYTNKNFCVGKIKNILERRFSNALLYLIDKKVNIKHYARFVQSNIVFKKTRRSFVKEEDYPEFATVKQICQLFAFLNRGGIRHLLFSNKEFRKKCTRNMGKKILFHIPSLLDFLRNQPSKKTEYKRKK